MKPTVINNNNNNLNDNNNNDNNLNNPQMQQTPQQQQQQYQPHSGSPSNQPSGGGIHSRRFPFYSGFDFDDDEIFSNAGLRSRLNLNRMRDPWGTWGPRKRRSSLQGDQGIDDDEPNEEFNMFPNMTNPFDTSAWNRTTPRKRAQAQQQQPQQQQQQQPHHLHHHDDDLLDDDHDHSAFFRNIPDEFRKYIPDDFDFPMMRSHINRPHLPTQPPQPPPRAETNIRFETAPPIQKQSPQQHQQQPQQNVGKPKFCDAAMQTDESLGLQQEENQNVDPNQNLNSHGLRNTMDMGQKSTEECQDRGQRARSAPPEKTPGNSYASANSNSTSGEDGGPNGQQPPQAEAFATTSPDGATSSAYATASAGTNTYPTQANFYPRQYYYPFQQQQQQPQQTRQQHQQRPTQWQPFQTPPPPQQQAHPQTQQNQSTQPTTPGGTFVRHVPIVLESRKVPPKTAPKPTSPQANQPIPTNQPIPMPDAREIPIQIHNQGTPVQNTPPKQPANDLIIAKIRGIQQDVMELMIQIDKFSGNRQDKQYIWLDEMLTRNLIKLDDIETDGKENIRLARREAIKCIQASLAVLEMKADGRTSLRQESVPMDTEQIPEQILTDQQISMDVDQKSPAPVQQSEDVPVTEQQNPINNNEITTNLEKTDDEENLKKTTTDETVKNPETVDETKEKLKKKKSVQKKDETKKIETDADETKNTE